MSFCYLVSLFLVFSLPVGVRSNSQETGVSISQWSASPVCLFLLLSLLVVVALCHVFKAGSSVLQEPSSCLVRSQLCLALRGAVIVSKRRTGALVTSPSARMGSAFTSDRTECCLLLSGKVQTRPEVMWWVCCVRRACAVCRAGPASTAVLKWIVLRRAGFGHFLCAVQGRRWASSHHSCEGGVSLLEPREEITARV